MATTTRLDPSATLARSHEIWEREIVPTITDYIRIPNKSPGFDKDWEANGHMEKACSLIHDWCKKRPIPGLKIEKVKLPKRTPLLYMEIPGKSDRTVVLYGHFDKQPEMVGWRQGLGPWTPVREGDKLYGRGGADDGYASFASLTALQLLAEKKVPHARCVVLIEGCEESGSYDLPFYIEHLAERIGSPELVVCLDSGCGDYERLWNTTSLRGNITGELIVEILREGVHSGDASGIVPDSFRIARMLISRLEDEKTGKLLLPALQAKVPPERAAQVRAAGEVLGNAVFDKFPFVEGAHPTAKDRSELILARTWQPTLTVTGADGLPPVANAGNVLRPETRLKLSLRSPPTVDAKAAARAVKELLEKDPPYGARVRFDKADGSSGWNAPPLAEWLERSIDGASQAFFGAGCVSMGEGGTIPFMGMLGEKFPKAQFLITGVLGPASNAHGPNEFLHIPTGEKLTACVAQVLADHLA